MSVSIHIPLLQGHFRLTGGFNEVNILCQVLIQTGCSCMATAIIKQYKNKKAVGSVTIGSFQQKYV